MARAAREAIPNGQIQLREFAGTLIVNRASCMVKRSIISAGGMNCTVVDPKIVFMHVLLSGVGGFVLFHNHPSSELNPSMEDLLMTKRILEGAEILALDLLNHIVVDHHSHFSFADNGLL